MTYSVVPTDIDSAVARDWLHHSLEGGDVISRAALSVIERCPERAYALVPATVDRARLGNLHEGGVCLTAGARAALGTVLDVLVKRGAAAVVVEDELRLRADQNPTVDGLLQTAFIGERVVHWAPLKDDTTDAIITVERGSHGYPLNALCNLGFRAGAKASEWQRPRAPVSLRRSLSPLWR
jgi:hypothetical protein